MQSELETKKRSLLKALKIEQKKVHPDKSVIQSLDFELHKLNTKLNLSTK